MIVNIIAFLWGFAEATLFFIVPDVWLSIVVLSDNTIGFQSCLYTLAGALCGGSLMYYLGKKNLEQFIDIFLKIPAIRLMDIEKVKSDMQKWGIVAMLWGPLLGIPYKIYAIHAHLVTSIFLFLLVSIPARIVRFVFVTWATPYLMNSFFANVSISSQIWIVSILWLIFYTGYFLIKRKVCT